MKNNTLAFPMPQLFNSALVSEKGRLGLTALTDRLPTLTDNPRQVLRVVSDHLRKEGFSYRERIASLDDVVSSKSGSCLGLTMLVTSMLLHKGKSPQCKILIHPRDAVDEADKKLFDELMQGGYFDYRQPVLPKVSNQPPVENRINRFVPLCHPVVFLEGVPLETTAVADVGSDPLIEHAAESSNIHDVEVLMSYYFSDKAKGLFDKLNSSVREVRALSQEFRRSIQSSLDILPSNRDALMLQWSFGRGFGLEDVAREAKRKLLELEASDSDLSYKLWLVTDEVKYLDRTLEQFPQHIPAFLDRKVFLEKDVQEARMNLAVALWCINYSNVFDLRIFLKDLQVKKKIRELKFNNN